MTVGRGVLSMTDEGRRPGESGRARGEQVTVGKNLL